MLAPLGAVAGVQFVSLQKGAGEDDTSASLTLVGGGAALGDMADTAVAHLAGALGTPCWLLLPHYRPDWRWLAGRTDSPWYRAMRLFHQPAPGGWAPLIAQVAEQLTRWRQQAMYSSTGIDS